MSMFAHIEDDRLRAVLESDTLSPAEFDWAMQYTRDCLALDDTNEDVPEHIQDIRWGAFSIAEDTDDHNAAIHRLRQVWSV